MDEIKNEEKKKPAIIHTFKDDVNKYIEEKNISLTDIALKEQKRYKETTQKNIKNSYIIISVFLLLFLLAASVLVFKFLRKQPLAEEKDQISKPLVFSEETSPVYLSEEEDLKTVFKELYSKKYKKNVFTYLPFVKDKKTVNTSDFLNNLKVSATPELLKSLGKEFTLVNYSDGTVAYPLIVFKITYFKPAYKSMFLWEKDVLRDLSPVLPSIINENIALLSNDFKDKVINNLDARVLSLENGNPVLIYGFFSEKFLIITTSEEVFKISVERLKTHLAE